MHLALITNLNKTGTIRKIDFLYWLASVKTEYIFYLQSENTISLLLISPEIPDADVLKVSVECNLIWALSVTR